MRKITRREFTELMAAATAAFAAHACGVPAKRPTKPYVESPDLPSLGGAPDTPEGRTVAAFLDTVVPGKHRDPTGAPGALDVSAAKEFFDPNTPVKNFVPLLVLVLDSVANSEHGAAFAELKPAQREEVLGKIEATLPEIGFAIQLAKVAYYASDEAGRHLGYPGANAGYIDHPSFSFKRALAQPAASTLNPNHPGNLP